MNIPSASNSLFLVLLRALNLLALALWLGGLVAIGLTPAMDLAQAQGKMTDFDRMHHEYEQVSTLFQMPLLLLLTLFTVLRDRSPASVS